MKGRTWMTQVVNHLRICKDQGRTFNEAWAITMLLYPPSRFDLDGESESLYSFFRRSCSDAWHDRQPKLAQFGDQMLLGGDDESRRARRKRPEAA